MSSFDVETKTVTQTYTIEQIQILNLHVDIANSVMNVTVGQFDVDQNVIVSTNNITISGADYSNILNISNLDAYIAAQLSVTQI